MEIVLVYSSEIRPSTLLCAYNHWVAAISPGPMLFSLYPQGVCGCHFFPACYGWKWDNREPQVSLPLLKGALKLNPPSAPMAPVWCCDTLCLPPFESLAQSKLKWLSKDHFFQQSMLERYMPRLWAIPVCLWPNTAFLSKGDLSHTSVSRRCWSAMHMMVCYGSAKKVVLSPNSARPIGHCNAIANNHSAMCRAMPSGVKCHSTYSVSTSWAILTFSRYSRVNMANPHPLGIVLQPSSSALSLLGGYSSAFYQCHSGASFVHFTVHLESIQTRHLFHILLCCNLVLKSLKKNSPSSIYTQNTKLANGNRILEICAIVIKRKGEHWNMTLT